MGEENINLAGLGNKLYFCRKEDFEKDPAPLPMQEVKLTPHVGDIAFAEWYEPQEGEDGWSGKGGFSTTFTATIEPTPELKKLIRRLTQGEGRLPRRRKKQVMNRVLRHEDRCRAIARFIVRPMFDKSDALTLTAQVMFHDRVRGTVLTINEAEFHAAYLCLKRIEKKYRKYIKALESEGQSVKSVKSV